ncbi:MAG TPA: cytochrome c family protein [Bradyrhizobium sp.]|jgi:cytochrome c
MRIATALSVLALIGAAHADDGKVVRGAARFADCVDCHRLEPGANNVGPSLHGIFTRKAGEVVGFSYSPALKRSGIVWTPETLDKFIRDPQAMVPGNRMSYAGMINADDRADLIAFLLKATQY